MISEQTGTSRHGRIGRPVRIVSISFPNGKSLAEIAEIVDQEAAHKTDLIILPETWLGQDGHEPEALDGPTVTTMADLARWHETYIACPIDRFDGVQRFNSLALIDRGGRVASVYDKAFPYWSEYNVTPPVEPGKDVSSYQTDFGCLGMAICFDVNFQELWRRLAYQGAELVIWPSAYSAGTALQAHALNYHFYIVTSTQATDCLVYDITGEEILYRKGDDLLVTRLTLDLDRCIFHENFNIAKRDRLLAEHGDDIALEKWMPREQWFVLKAKRPGVSARELARQYGLEDLRDYIWRSRRQINAKRGWEVSDGVS